MNFKNSLREIRLVLCNCLLSLIVSLAPKDTEGFILIEGVAEIALKMEE
jgi:hypothetical protein